jgi:hypothetical protein
VERDEIAPLHPSGRYDSLTRILTIILATKFYDRFSRRHGVEVRKRGYTKA